MTVCPRRRIFFGLLTFSAFAAATALAAAENIDAVTVYIRCTAEGKPVSQGSGVLVSADGLVLTAKHVVPDESYDCEGSIGSSRAPRRGIDRTPRSTPLDALLLRFTPGPGEAFPHVGYCPLGAELKEQPIKAAGFFPDASNQGRPSPQPSPRMGIVSSVFPDAKGWIQTTVPTAQGMSGGPVLLEGGGSLVGIVAGAAFDPATGQPQYHGVLAAQEVAVALGLEQAAACGSLAGSSLKAACPLYDLSGSLDLHDGRITVRQDCNILEWTYVNRVFLHEFRGIFSINKNLVEYKQERTKTMVVLSI